jgi:hypothetical protein
VMISSFRTPATSGIRGIAASPNAAKPPRLQAGRSGLTKRRTGATSMDLSTSSVCSNGERLTQAIGGRPSPPKGRNRYKISCPRKWSKFQPLQHLRFLPQTHRYKISYTYNLRF